MRRNLQKKTVKMASVRKRLGRSWKFIMALVTPFLLLPVFFVHDEEVIPSLPYETFTETEGVLVAENETSSEDEESGSGDSIGLLYNSSRKFKLAYVLMIMAIYWAFEVIPLPVTSLFPLVLFPLFGIDDAANVSKSYMKESNTIFLGGAICALAIEFCSLHRRVALRLITIVGVSPFRLMLGIMGVVSFLSMWISNTTCVALIVPIIVAIVDEIHEVTDATKEDLEANNNDASFKSHSLRRKPLSRGESFRNGYSQPGTPSLNRHSSAFANAALSSHDSVQSIPEEEDIGRSTLGVLEGHRSSSDINEHQHNYHLNHHQHLHHAEPTLNNNIEQDNVWKINMVNQSGFINKPIHSQLSAIKEEFASEKRGNLRVLKRCLSEPGRIEEMIDLPDSDLEAGDGLKRRKKIEREKWRKIKNMYLFALAYAANIGGTATITGTGPNKVFKEVIKPYSYDISEGGGLSMTFFTWMALNVPPMLVNIGIAFTYLIIKYCGLPKFSKTLEDETERAVEQWKDQHVRSYLVEEYKKLGKMNFHEIGVALVFLLVVFLWITRDPQIFTGWGDLSPDAKTGDSTAALLGAVLLFIIPRSWSFLTSKKDARFEALLDWKFVTQKLPWGVLLLLGSGYAIGDSADRTGLTRWIGQELYLLHDLPKPLLLFIVMAITALITEVVSNTACASIILPVLLGLSREMKIHPLYLSVAASVTASYAFMLPVASPVNAIVFAAADCSIYEMITNGYILNGICVVIYYINTLTLGECLFNYSSFTYPTPPNRTGVDSFTYNLTSNVDRIRTNFL